MNRMSIPDRRLIHLRIRGGKLDRADQVVKSLGAMQAQDYHQALWAIGLRMKASTVTEVEQAIEDRKIVLTWPMRGTIHFVPPEDVLWMLKLSASRTIAQSVGRREQLELDQKTIERSLRIIHDALNGDKRMTRPDLMQLLEDKGIRTSDQRGYHLLGYAAQSGFICLGPREGKQQTFVLLEDWVPQSVELGMDEALALLTERYFASHGPATVRDFAWWAGIKLSDARRGVEMVGSRLTSEYVDGQLFWEGADTSSNSDLFPSETNTFLLPGFDEHLLGYTDRSAVLRTEYGPYIIPGNNGVFKPTIVIDGQVVGIWKRTLKSKGIAIEIYLFEPREERKTEIEEAAIRYCAFMELPLYSLSFM